MIALGTAGPISQARPRRMRDSALMSTMISVVVGIAVWWLLAVLTGEKSLLPTPPQVVGALIKNAGNGRLFVNLGYSMFRVLVGFGIAFIMAVPLGFLMGWYAPVRGLVEPWIQFFRTIPPIALIPLVILAFGIGEQAKIFVIWVASFLTIVIAVFQGVKNVDLTLVKAARVLGANDWAIFADVVVPASFPYILVGVRLGLASAWSTLVASELIGAQHGLGYMIQEASIFFEIPTVMLGIVVIGVIGFAMDRGVLYLERELTSWQEKVE